MRTRPGRPCEPDLAPFRSQNSTSQRLLKLGPGEMKARAYAPLTRSTWVGVVVRVRR